MLELLPWLVLVTMLGACVGSFLNVVIYRLPLGQSIVHPPSACPGCGNRLKWYDNVPVLAWLWLRGRCRFCGMAISRQYPIIEGLTATLFAGLFIFHYFTPFSPAMAGSGLFDSWPVLVAQLVLIAALLAATVIDARTFQIPLSITWVVALTALIVLAIGVVLEPHMAQQVPLPPARVGGVTQLPRLRLEAVPEPYASSWQVRTAVKWGQSGDVVVTAAPYVTGPTIGMVLGAAAGLVLANVLLRFGKLPLSFPDSAESPDPTDEAAKEKGDAGIDPEEERRKRKERWKAALAAEADGGSKSAAGAPAEADPHFEPHPFPRREVLKECLFLILPFVGAAVGWWAWGLAYGSGAAAAAPFVIDLTGPSGPSAAAGDAAALIPPHIPPAGLGWLNVAGGVLLGYLVGGLTVWAMRVLGTLAFGREAMGLGDVHLLAAVGAVIGWKLAIAAFFIAPFLGLGWVVAQLGVSRVFKQRFREIPYGPHLAAASVIALLLREPLLTYAGIMLGP